MEYTAIEAVNAGLFSQDSIKEDEKLIKSTEKSMEKLPDSVRSNVLSTALASLPYKSYKYGKANMKITATTLELVSAIVTISGDSIIYAGGVYKTDGQIVKLATKLNELCEISIDDARQTLLGIVSDVRSQNQNPTFDQTVFSDALGDILEHEGYVLDFELMNYKKIIGTDVNGKNIYTTITHDVLTSTITANENARAINLDVRPLTKELLNYIKYYNDALKQQALAEIVENTKYNPNSGDFFDKFAEYVYGVYNASEPLDVFTVALKQMYWGIKRLTRELSVHNDLTLTLRGAQGIGKSYLVDAMFGTVLGKFYNPSAKISDIIDDRWTPALGNMLLVNIDESDVGGSSTYMSDKGMSPLKSRITNTVFSYRPLGTNMVVEVKKKATFISTSNFHIYEIMNDSSGMRRFLEFNSKNEKQQRFDYAKVAKIKELAFKAFQSIDENLEQGYWDINSEVGKKITEIQESYVTKPAINEFIEMLEVDTNMKYVDCVAYNTLYDQYESFCTDQKVAEKYRISKKNFRRKMEDLLEGSTKVQGNIWRFAVKFKNANVDDKDVFRKSFYKLGEL